MKRTIGYLIVNHFSVHTGLFAPNEAFNQAIRSQLDCFLTCSLQVCQCVRVSTRSKRTFFQLVALSSDLLREACRDAADEVQTYPDLRRTLLSYAENIMASFNDKTVEGVKVRINDCLAHLIVTECADVAGL